MTAQVNQADCPDAPEDQNTKIPLLDIPRGNGPLRQELLAEITRVIDSGQLILGPDCTALEESIATLCETDHAIGCASGSDALLLALMAMDVGPGDEVIVPSFTFFATVGAVWRLGARPVFADIDPDSFNIDPAAVEQRITTATKAIIPVHLFGQCAEMDAIVAIAQRHGLAVVEDAAQAIGAEFHSLPAGSLGDAGCFSFYPTKNLGGLGDGGMLTTSSDGLADRLRLLGAHGMKPRYHHGIVGINSRLDSIQAAALRVKLAHLPTWNLQRQANAMRYAELFTGAGMEDVVRLPTTASGCLHVWNQYTIRVTGGRRDSLREHLTRLGIGTEVYYPLPLHRQPCFAELGYAEGSLPESERAALEVLCLPIFPELTSQEQEKIVRAIGLFFGKAMQSAA